MSQPRPPTSAAPAPNRVALVTGTGRRLGTHIATTLHNNGWRVVLHYHRSSTDARALCETFNSRRADSAFVFAMDLRESAALPNLISAIDQRWGRLDALINNAAVFRATRLGESTTADWDDVFNVNLKAPYFLSQAAAPLLRASAGCIVNLTDIYAERPRADYAIYCTSKAGLIGLTRALARDLAPLVRVNAVSPGAILWTSDATATEQAAILARTPLGRAGEPADIAEAVCYLIDAPYVTGQVLTVDGGRLIFDA